MDGDARGATRTNWCYRPLPGTAGRTGMQPSDLKEFYVLLRRTEPVAGEYDVSWTGPWVIERGRRWWPTSFALYRGVVYGAIHTDMADLTWAWRIADGEVAPDERISVEARWTWEREMPRLLARLRFAVAHPDRYNRHVGKWLPLESRRGVVQRALAWPEGFAPVPSVVVAEARQGLEAAQRALTDPLITRCKARCGASRAREAPNGTAGCAGHGRPPGASRHETSSSKARSAKRFSQTRGRHRTRRCPFQPIWKAEWVRERTVLAL